MNAHTCTCCGKAPATHHYCDTCYSADLCDIQEKYQRLLAAAKMVLRTECVMPDAIGYAIRDLRKVIHEAEETPNERT